MQDMPCGGGGMQQAVSEWARRRPLCAWTRGNGQDTRHPSTLPCAAGLGVQRTRANSVMSNFSRARAPGVKTLVAGLADEETSQDLTTSAIE